MVAKPIVGLNSLLSPVWHLWVHSWPGNTGIDGAADADASPNNCKLDLTWIFSVSYHRPLNETHKNNAKFSQNPTKTPNSNLLSWNHISVFSWGTPWNFNFLGKLLSLDVFWFRVHFLSRKPQKLLWKSTSQWAFVQITISKHFLNLTYVLHKYPQQWPLQENRQCRIRFKRIWRMPLSDEGESSKLLGKKKERKKEEKNKACGSWDSLSPTNSPKWHISRFLADSAVKMCHPNQCF